MTPAAPASSRDALPPGTRLMDYDIEGLLGAGGFGLVYRARDEALHRMVAIKEYLPSALALRGEGGQVVLRSPSHEEPFALGLKSFVNEARLLARFDHPSLVKVFRFWEAHGTAYMVMPCYEGPTLYDARRQLEGPPDEGWLRALMDPLLGALDCLHREQVFHRDVAPDNILVVQDPDAACGFRPVLLDFGAARRVISENTQALTAILKPSFAPIEQYAETTQLRQGPWTDLYGLAAVLHYCVTGRTPVPATARAVDDDMPRLRQMAPALLQDLGRRYDLSLLSTIDRGLSVKPSGRPASVGQWREMLASPPPPEQAETALSPVEGERPAEGRRNPPASPTIVVTPFAREGRFSTTDTALLTTDDLQSTGGVPLGSWPRGLVWGLGAAALAGVVALSAWTVQRPSPGLSAGTLPSAPATARSSDAARPSAADIRIAEAAAPLPVGGPAAQDGTQAGGEVDRRALPTHDTRRRPAAGAQASDDGGTAGGAEAVPPPRAPSPRVADDAGHRGATRVAARTPLNPRLACGDRMFIALAICMKRYCSRPQYRQHGECVRMRQQEEAQQQLTRHGYP